MAIGFTPRYTLTQEIGSYTSEEFLALTIAAAEGLRYRINYVSKSGLIAYTNRGLFKANAIFKVKIEDGMATFTSESSGNEMIDFGRNRKNVEQFLDQFDFEKSLISASVLKLKVDELKMELSIHSDEDDLLKLPPPTTKEQLGDFLNLFKPTKGYLITPILVNINLLLFILMACLGVNPFTPEGEQLLAWGGNFRPLTLNGEFWRLVTNFFLHNGVIHLVMNMFALLYIGVFLEPILGRSKFIAVYLLTGIAASVTSICWHELGVSVGASGAIFGLYGAFLALLTTNLLEKETRKPLLISIGVFVVYNLTMGLKEGTDNAAHLGGLLTGIFIGIAFFPAIKRRDEPSIQVVAIGFLSLLILTCCSIVYVSLPNNSITDQRIMTGDLSLSRTTPSHIASTAALPKEYQDLMGDFHSVYTMALDIFPVDTTLAGRQKSMEKIENPGLYYWKRSFEILDQVDQLKLPADIREKNKVWRKLCLLHEKSYRLMFRAVDEHTKKYDEEINKLFDEIKAMRQSINMM